MHFSLIDLLLECLEINTETCDESSMERIDMVVFALRKLRGLCPNPPPVAEGRYLLTLDLDFLSLYLYFGFNFKSLYRLYQDLH